MSILFEQICKHPCFFHICITQLSWGSYNFILLLEGSGGTDLLIIWSSLPLFLWVCIYCEFTPPGSASACASSCAETSLAISLEIPGLPAKYCPSFATPLALSPFVLSSSVENRIVFSDITKKVYQQEKHASIPLTTFSTLCRILLVWQYRSLRVWAGFAHCTPGKHLIQSGSLLPLSHVVTQKS